jgi:hypothetical protein
MRALVAPLSLIMLAANVLITGCVSTRIKERSLVDEGFAVSGEESFYLAPLQVIAFEFHEKKEIRTILNKKLRFEFSSLEGVRLHRNSDEARYLIIPELIVKRYEKRYEQRYYYRLGVSVISGGQSRARFSYEYSGKLSIFEIKVQNLMLKKLTRDFNNAFVS